jgi:hypothetical protein
MWRRPRLVTAERKARQPRPGSNAGAAWSLRAGPGNGAGGGTWADNATAERREAGLPTAREGPRLASVASRVTCATSARLDASRRSATPLAGGAEAEETKEGRKEKKEREKKMKETKKETKMDKARETTS